MVHDSFSSHSDGEVEFPQAFEIAEQFGTPPTRSRSIGGRRERFVAKDVSVGRGQKRDRHTQKTDRQKGRLDARYHKELDTTLQVLGIDGDVQKPLAPVRITTSVHAPLVDETPLAPRRTASIASSSVFFSPRAGFGRTPSDAAFSELSVDDQLVERQGLQDRKGSLPPRHPGSLTPVSPGARQPSPRASQGLASVEDLGDGAMHRLHSERLQSERQEWHADLDSLLEGNFASEDLDLTITLAKNKANDLKEQLTWWARPPEADWPTREQRLEWLEHALGEAQDIMRAMQTNGALDADISTYVDIVRVVLKDLRGMACMIGEAVAEGLRALEPAHHDTKRGFRAANKALHLVLDLTKMLRHISRLDPGAGLELDSTDLGTCAQEIVLATLQATATLQDSLLFPGALSPGSVHSGHELQVKARMLQMCWDSCGKLMDFVAHFWPEKRGSLYCEWCKLFLKAATAAERMQEALRQQSSDNLGLDCLSIDETPCPGASGVWGSRTRWNSKSNGTVSDEDLQAQAWLPSCLRALLAEAEKAADAVLSWETGAEYEGGGTSCASTEEASNSPKGTGAACIIIVEALSESMYDLAHIGAQRVAKLCREPSGLACWALELLEEQACMAVLFVRDLDRGILGRGSHGLQQYEMLRRGTDALVNGILRVRRLLKQKRTADGDDTPVGAPLQPAIPSNASTSSLSSDVTSLSTTSAARQSASRTSFSSLTRIASADPRPEEVTAEDTASRPLTPATPTRKVEGILSAALSSARDVTSASQPAPSLATPKSNSVAPVAAAAEGSQSTPSLATSTSSAAIAIPRTSALPAHSTWGKASKAGSAAPRASPQPPPKSASQDGSADRDRMARFAAGQAQQQSRSASPSKDGSAKDGSTTDSSLKAVSRDQSFVFVGHQGGGQLASSPEQLPQIGQPAQPAKPTPAVSAAAAAKPSPAAQHASFRRWASQLDNSPSAQPGVAPEVHVTTAGVMPSGDDAVAARFLDAMLQPAEPQAAQLTAAEMPSAAAALVRPMPMLTPLPSPFDTEEFQRTSVPVSQALQQAAPPRDSAFLGFPRRSTMQPSTAAASNGAPVAPNMPGPSGSQVRTDHDRQPGKDRRHSKWKNFGRSGFACPQDAEPSQDGDLEDSPQARQGGGRDKGPRGRFSRGSRGRREEEPASASQAPPERLDSSALGQPERAGSGKPGLLRRFKDALRRPGSGGGGSRMDRQESTTMDRQESVLLPNGSGGPLPEPSAVQDNLAGIREESSHVPSSRGPPPDSRHHRSSRHRGHYRQHERPREPEPDRSSDGRRRHGRRNRRHSSRGRPTAALEPRPEQRPRRRTDGPLAKPAALVMPWEGDPFWQIKWEDIKPALVRKVGSGGFAQVYEVYMYGALMAVKIVNLKADQDLNLSEALVRFKDEVDLQRRLSLHPNVVRFMGACCHIPSTGRPFQDDTLDNWQGVTLAILMELCQYGTLYDVMNQARRIMHINQDIQSGRLPLHYLQNSELKSRPGYKLLRSWRLRLDLALQAAAALSYTHDHGVVHRDLTSTNLLVTNKWECKLSDFGLSRAIEGSHLPNSGQLNSLEWMAPERLVGEDYGTAADVFSYGVVLWELLTLEQPWFNDHERPGLCSRIMPEVHGGNQLFVIRQVPLGVRLPLPSAQDVEPPLPDLPQVVSIIEDCWKEAAQRPSMKQIFERLKVIVDGLKAQESGHKSALR